MNPILDEALEALRNQQDEVALGPSIIFRSLKKLGNDLKRFSPSGKPLIRYCQLLGQILNSLLDLHKFPVSSTPN
jgi:hypothetical protein